MRDRLAEVLAAPNGAIKVDLPLAAKVIYTVLTERGPIKGLVNIAFYAGLKSVPHVSSMLTQLIASGLVVRNKEEGYSIK